MSITIDFDVKCNRDLKGNPRMHLTLLCFSWLFVFYIVDKYYESDIFIAMSGQRYKYLNIKINKLISLMSVEFVFWLFIF